MDNLAAPVASVQNIAAQVTPVPTDFNCTTSAQDLKARLDWGEPALTIIDVRDHDDFLECHIMGAISSPMVGLSKMAVQSLEPSRDIYLYGASDADAVGAVTQLTSSGFQNVSALQGGLSAWQAAGGAVEDRNV